MCELNLAIYKIATIRDPLQLHPMNVINWNLEWASNSSARGKEISRLIASSTPSVMCLTETTLGMLPKDGHVLLPEGNSGYPGPANRRKVALWSSAPWTETDLIGHPDLPGGRFVSGVTHGIRFVGVCIPWHASHVSNGRKDRKLWEDHLSYLHLLRPILERYLELEIPLCVLGDFNQTIPQGWQPDPVFQALWETFAPPLSLPTAELTDPDGKLLIDHFATSPDLRFSLKQWLPKESEAGIKLSDHTGILADIF
jgi:Endonuclease/Exonuclease/phosphatase family